jgi:iduronate 2-sulfatase
MVKNYRNFPPPEEQTHDFKRLYLRAYLANISYLDACAGLVLDALEQSGLAGNTIVVVIGDHGYFMGEHGSWGHKHSNYETATRAPLLVRAPGMRSAGQGTSALVEFVDFYPTLSELAGLPVPAHVEGASFAPLLDEPGLPWKKAAFSEMIRGQRLLGRSLRTATHRYVEWLGPERKRVVARELYDLGEDAVEQVNLADDPEHAARLDELAELLKEGWRSALP